MNIVAYYRYCT